MAVLPNNLHQYWRHRGYLATTSIEAILNILHPEILRNLNDNDVLKNPLELNSPEENQVRQEAPRQNSVTSASYRFQKYPRDPKKNWVRRGVELNYYVKIPHQSMEEEKKESYSPIYN